VKSKNAKADLELAKLKNELLSYVEHSHLEIHQSPPDEICGMCLDLFTII
jgi:hypothetical protein